MYRFIQHFLQFSEFYFCNTSSNFDQYNIFFNFVLFSNFIFIWFSIHFCSVLVLEPPIHRSPQLRLPVPFCPNAPTPTPGPHHPRPEIPPGVCLERGAGSVKGDVFDRSCHPPPEVDLRSYVCLRCTKDYLSPHRAQKFTWFLANPQPLLQCHPPP